LVWGRISGDTGPYFFETSEGSAVTATPERCLEMFCNFCELELLCRIDVSSVRFQQDGATARTARASLNSLPEQIPQHLTSQGGDAPWPALSPCLSTCV